MSEFAAQGCYTALVTPFSPDGASVDWAAYERLLEFQIENKVSGLVPCGTTGETPTLSFAETMEIVRRAVRVAKGRVPVLVGTGSNSTAHTIDASRAAFEAGADAVMIVMPYYNRPSQEGLYRHVELVAKAVSGPVVLYNIPGRTAVDLSIETLDRILGACPNVVGMKDASGNVLYCQAVASLGRSFFVLCGDDALTVPMMSVGATGVISVTANLYPREVSAVTADMLAGNWDRARAGHLRLAPVHRALFVEPSPSPIKAALAARGRMSGAVRPPLVPLSEHAREPLLRILESFEANR